MIPMRPITVAVFYRDGRVTQEHDVEPGVRTLMDSSGTCFERYYARNDGDGPTHTFFVEKGVTEAELDRILGS